MTTALRTDARTDSAPPGSLHPVVRRYSSLKQCVNAFLNHPANAPLPNGNWHTSTETMTMRQMLARARRASCWGWCERKKTLHLWIGPKADILNAVDLIAHEIGHIMRPWHKSNRAEEHKAKLYGAVAAEALQIMLSSNVRISDGGQETLK